MGVSADWVGPRLTLEGGPDDPNKWFSLYRIVSYIAITIVSFTIIIITLFTNIVFI